MIFPLKMVIFHCYVSSPEGNRPCKACDSHGAEVQFVQFCSQFVGSTLLPYFTISSRTALSGAVKNMVNFSVP